MTRAGDVDRATEPGPRVLEPPEEPAAPREQHRPIILVVDDSSDMRHLLRDVLEPHGHEVVTASSSAGALAFLSQRVPDLVITDLMMPGLSGFALRSLMLRRAELAAVPVIVLSAYWARPEETLDAVAVLTKPVNLDRLLESVEEGLARASGP